MARGPVLTDSKVISGNTSLTNAYGTTVTPVNSAPASTDVIIMFIISGCLVVTGTDTANVSFKKASGANMSTAAFVGNPVKFGGGGANMMGWTMTCRGSDFAGGTTLKIGRPSTGTTKGYMVLTQVFSVPDGGLAGDGQFSGGWLHSSTGGPNPTRHKVQGTDHSSLTTLSLGDVTPDDTPDDTGYTVPPGFAMVATPLWFAGSEWGNNTTEDVNSFTIDETHDTPVTSVITYSNWDAGDGIGGTNYATGRVFGWCGTSVATEFAEGDDAESALTATWTYDAGTISQNEARMGFRRMALLYYVEVPETPAAWPPPYEPISRKVDVRELPHEVTSRMFDDL